MTWVNQGMQNLIPLINRIQDAFTQIGTTPNIDLPQIAVVGGQSSGKSSVLESFVGKDFLPRGSGIVTRRPLILQLVNDPANEYGEFLHKKGHKFVDFDQIRKEIEDETDRVTGANRGISPIPINLCVYSPHVLNLTLIDLPGMTKVPVGDQPADIEQQIRDMILTYIARETCLILAVTPANSDLATSDALKLAKEVDKEGNRTILVLTKLDLMDAGTDAMDVLTGKLVPVKLGIIGVVNRSQADINANKSVQESLKDEAKFLNKKYPTLASINGTPYLAKTLNRLLMHHIRECLPKLKLRVSTMMIQCQTILRGYGEPVTDKARTLLQIITHFATAYNSTIDGTSRNIETTELSGGARICYIFHETFSSALEKLNPMENLSQLDILTAIRNATGSRPALFIPEVSFELLVKRQIQRLEEPSLNCVDLVYEEMLRIVQHCGLEIQQEMQRFPHLYERIHEVITNVLSSRLAPTKEFVSNLIAIQLAYVNSRHPEFSDAAMINALQEAPSPFQSNAASLITEDFNELQLINKKFINAEIGEKLENNGEEINRRRHQQNESTKFAQKSAYSSFRINPFFKRTNQAPENSTTQLTNGTGSILTRTTEKTVTRVLSFREKRDCTVIERLIKSYFVIVRKTIQDTVPKAIMNFLVNNIRDNLQSELVRQLYKENDFDALLAESEFKAQKRAETVEMLEALNKANQLISEIRETHIW